MSEKWVSQARKWCDYCRCWLADNKASRQFHESGAKHKQAVQDFVVAARKRGGERKREEDAQAAMLEAINKAGEEQFLAETIAERVPLAGDEVSVTEESQATDDSGVKKEIAAQPAARDQIVKIETENPKPKPKPKKEEDPDKKDENTGIGQWKSVKIKKVKVNKDKAATEQGERIKEINSKRRAARQQIQFKTKETPDVMEQADLATSAPTGFKRRKGNPNARRRRDSDDD